MNPTLGKGPGCLFRIVPSIVQLGWIQISQNSWKLMLMEQDSEDSETLIVNYFYWSGDMTRFFENNNFRQDFMQSRKLKNSESFNTLFPRYNDEKLEIRLWSPCKLLNELSKIEFYLTPLHQSGDFKWKDYCSMVFSVIVEDPMFLEKTQK